MKIMLFLGSGISFPSGLPCAGQITDSALSGEWYKTTAVARYGNGPHARYHRLEDNLSLRAAVENSRRMSHKHYQTRQVTQLQQFLKLLKTDANEYFIVTKRSREANYEDLYYLADQLENEESAKVDNPAVLFFWQKIKEESESAGLRSPDERRFPNERTSLSPLVQDSCNFIADVVIQNLWVSKSLEPKGLECLLELAKSRRVGRLDIFTLNHDCLIERLFSLNNVRISDGFGDLSHAGIRSFDRNTYDSGTKVRLFKLHGSLDWRLFGGIISPQVGLELCGTDPDCSPQPCVLQSGILLVGTYNKIADYSAGLFSELHWRFHQALLEHDTMIMSGYGWNDHAINQRLCDWLETSSSQRLILFHRNPKDVLTRARVKGWSYKRFLREKKLVRVRKYLSDPGAVEEMSALLGLQ